MNDQQKLVSGSVLSFYCIIASISLNHLIAGLLSNLLKVGEKYTYDLREYVDIIDLLSNPNKSKQYSELIRRSPNAASIIGKSLMSDLPQEFRLKNRGR